MVNEGGFDGGGEERRVPTSTRFGRQKERCGISMSDKGRFTMVGIRTLLERQLGWGCI